MSGKKPSDKEPTQAHKHAEALRGVASSLRVNIELRRAKGTLGKYGQLWESAAATCDDAASYLDEIDMKEKEARHE
ncbi:hypothetical protein [Adlercreutzia muris]|uniref:hypothetical protein n=1 Tax=Adlercreutzia muris TaxID=1796610 RepID=UPI001F56AACA|nr:hypothetical protein [Adlercreutzia muris]